MEENMVEEILDPLDVETGVFVKDNKEQIEHLAGIANQIRDEFAKISKHKLLGQSIQEILEVELYILDNTEKPKYKLYVYGDARNEVEKICREVIDVFIEERHYAFHNFHDQLDWQFSHVIGDGLNESMVDCEFWCSIADRSMSFLGNPAYLFYVIKFDKHRLSTDITFDEKRHPLLDELRIEWEREFGKFFNMHKKINYNELFRRASARDHFLYFYQDDFNALSAMKYENEINRGSIISIRMYRDDIFEEVSKNYDVSLRLANEIKVAPENYKKIRKLLEMTQDGLSLLMNDQGEVFAIGKMRKEYDCEFYKVCFTNFLEWKFYKNEEEYLRFNNMLPSFPERGTGIQKKDIELLMITFGKRRLNKLKMIIECATKQKHGTMVVFTEDANEEVERLEASALPIIPTKLLSKQIEAVTSIDGALICDEEGVCHAIGTILDGRASNSADSSRGARYNSAIRYRDMRKNDKKKTFIVIVSEDGYIDCISTC